jgi:GNAT superfamily N-acetyltransferase
MIGIRTDTDTPPVIRRATGEDLSALTALLKALFTIEEKVLFDEEKQRRGLSLMLDGCGKHRRVMVAELAEEVVGMCSAQIFISTAEAREVAVVEDVVVREDYRGKGIGTALMDSLEKWARGRGIARLRLLTDWQNQDGIDFCLKQGWHRTQLACLRKQLDR